MAENNWLLQDGRSILVEFDAAATAKAWGWFGNRSSGEGLEFDSAATEWANHAWLRGGQMVQSAEAGGSTIIEADANSSGSSSATGIAATVFATVSASAGIASATGISAAVEAGVSSSSGTGIATGIAAFITESVAVSAGTGTALADSSSTAASVASSDGFAIALADAEDAAVPVTTVGASFGGGRHRKRKPELPPEFRPPKLVLVEKVQGQDIVLQILPAPAVLRNPVLADALRRARAGKDWTPARAVPESVIAALNKPIPILAKKQVAGKALSVEDDDNEILYLMYG